jgi:hypothetical protein
MADVSAIFGILLFLGITFPGMLFTWYLLFPKVTENAQQRIHQTPWKSFWFGFAIAVGISIPSAIMISLPFGPAQFLGWAMITVILGFASLGATGLTLLMANRLNWDKKNSNVQLPQFMRAALALEFAAAFPIIGWFIVIPLTILVCLGASSFAVLGWMPKTHSNQTSVDSTVDKRLSELQGLPHDAISS